MKKINLPIISFHEQRGEIASILTFATVVIMIIGILVGNKINKEGTRTVPKATGLSSSSSK